MNQSINTDSKRSNGKEPQQKYISNALFLTFDSEFSGIIFSLFGNRQNIFHTIFSIKFVVKHAAKMLEIG